MCHVWHTTSWPFLLNQYKENPVWKNPKPCAPFSMIWWSISRQRVPVDFDNAGQTPLSFIYREKTYVIREVLGRFLKKEGLYSNGFLVNVDRGEVFFIYFHTRNSGQRSEICEGNWVLCFRVLEDRELMAFYREDRKMLLNMTMKRLVDFHGHLCPDLIIGAKLSEYIQQLVSEASGLNVSISILAQNCTSAIDAIQILLGATFGNQRLQVMDFWKACLFTCNK